MNFVKNPNLPKKDVNLFIADTNLPNKDIIFPDNAANIPFPLSRHADIQMCHVGDNIIVTAPQCFEYYKTRLKKFGFEIIKGENPLNEAYPKDIAYNAAIIGKYAFHNWKFADKKIIELMKNRGLSLTNVNQGYSKCSCTIINETAFITQDEGIKNAAVGFDVLLISPGGVELEGFPYGFLGGATGMVSNDTLAVNGSIENHQDYEKIMKFLDKYKIKVLNLHDGKPVDIGSIIPLMY